MEKKGNGRKTFRRSSFPSMPRANAFGKKVGQPRGDQNLFGDPKANFPPILSGDGLPVWALGPGVVGSRVVEAADRTDIRLPQWQAHTPAKKKLMRAETP